MAGKRAVLQVNQPIVTKGADAPRRTVTFAFHFHGWKRPILERYFPDRQFRYVPLYISAEAFRDEWVPRILAEHQPEIFVWSLRAPEGLREFADRHGIRLFFMEDGFVRSLAPSASRTPPLSLALDSGTVYFDSRSPSDLERLLSTYAFDDDPDLLARAEKGIRFLLETGVSKYNSATDADVAALYGPKDRKRVLVIGQVEDDASILYGCDRPFTNNDLVRLAAQENPGAQIIYKPHPDILNRVRLAQSDPADVAGICDIIDRPLSMSRAFETIDHVYSITSLAGFEALMRGLKVTVCGSPFYAGWGLTDDRQPNARRERKLSVLALFAGAYLLYPRYFDPVTGAEVSFEATVALIERYLADPPAVEAPQAPVRPAWKPWGAYGFLGWRHLLTPVVAQVVKQIGGEQDVKTFRANPIEFFRELSKAKYRKIGRLLYPFDE